MGGSIFTWDGGMKKRNMLCMHSNTLIEYIDPGQVYATDYSQERVPRFEAFFWLINLCVSVPRTRQQINSFSK